MLVLSRKTGQRIAIGDGVVITLVKARAGLARIGIEAPRDVPINRTELLAPGRRAEIERRLNGHGEEARS